MAFERGFKTWCEKYATEKRKTLGIDPTGPLNSMALAADLKVIVRKPEDIPNINQNTLDVLLRKDGTPSCWSAVTLVSGSRMVVILNSSHSQARQASDLTHELAHIVRGHKAQEVDITADGLMLLKSYDKLQEEEADWLSGCLLLPRDALVAIKRKGLDTATSATLYGVSVQMLNYRFATSGVNRQFT